MEIKRRKHGGLPRDERGFTLPELLTTIAILGILIAIAIVVWNNIIEARRVDAAANQLASDMRLAHTRATNQLTDWRIKLNTGSREYELQKLVTPHEEDEPDPEVEEIIVRSLPKSTKVHSTTLGDSEPFVELNSDGSLYAPNGPNGSIAVSSTAGDPSRKLTFLAATSRIKLD